MRVTIDAFGETELSRELLRFADRGRDPRPAFDQIRNRFFALERVQFESGGRYSGGWKPLSASYVAAKQRAGLRPNILQATGRLMKSLTSDDSDAIYRTTQDDMFVGSNVPYGVFHQSRAPRTVLPRRPPVEIPDSEKREWMKVLQRYLIEGTD